MTLLVSVRSEEILASPCLSTLLMDWGSCIRFNVNGLNFFITANHLLKDLFPLCNSSSSSRCEHRGPFQVLLLSRSEALCMLSLVYDVSLKGWHGKFKEKFSLYIQGLLYDY